jgi:hypothetical protein
MSNPRSKDSQAKKDRIQEKRNVMQTDPPGVNKGGTCQQCGANLRWWYNYKLCDRCLIIDENAVVQL